MRSSLHAGDAIDASSLKADVGVAFTLAKGSTGLAQSLSRSCRLTSAIAQSAASDADRSRDPRPLAATRPDVRFRADPGERLIGPPPTSSPVERRRVLALFGAGLIHAVVLSVLIFEHWLGPIAAPATMEIPVEIVVEPPPAPRPSDEEPAFDAPRAATKEKIERDAPDQSTKASPAAAPMRQPSSGLAAAETAGPIQEGERDAADKSPAPALDTPDAEVIRAPGSDREESGQRQARADAQVQPDNLATFGGEPFPPWSIGHPSSFESLPGLEIAGAAEETPIAGGNARATYLSIVYGMVMSHMHPPATVRGNFSKLEGVVVFAVDGAGALKERRIAHSSGLRELDSAALAAVVQAAPFPAPPAGAPMGLRFTYSVK